MAYRVVNEVDAASDDSAVYWPKEKEGSVATSGVRTAGGGGGNSVAAGGALGNAGTGTGRKMDEDEERDAVFFRLESLGYRVGQGLVERFVVLLQGTLGFFSSMRLRLLPRHLAAELTLHLHYETYTDIEVPRFSRDRPRFTDTLDVIKFLCKDLWMLVFRKQIDNLKTNHRGVYVLTDNSFKPFSRMSTVAGGQAVVRAQPFLWFPCGIIRGALAAMGINATVQAETSELPGATFQIKSITTGAKP